MKVWFSLGLKKGLSRGEKDLSPTNLSSYISRMFTNRFSSRSTDHTWLPCSPLLTRIAASLKEFPLWRAGVRLWAAICKVTLYRVLLLTSSASRLASLEIRLD